jgi:hypothetical protein
MLDSLLMSTTMARSRAWRVKLKLLEGRPSTTILSAGLHRRRHAPDAHKHTWV